jgi:hypothetical protein
VPPAAHETPTRHPHELPAAGETIAVMCGPRFGQTESAARRRGLPAGEWTPTSLTAHCSITRVGAKCGDADDGKEVDRPAAVHAVMGAVTHPPVP